MKSQNFPFSCRKIAKFAVLGPIILGFSPHANAQIVLDGTLGPQGALSGPNYQISSRFGQQIGRNLFHSFADFQLLAGESANFSGPASVRNILSRVTGGKASLLNGQINSSIAGANFFFINPAGMIFGPDVQLNVSGSFVATTADLVKLGGNGSFNALNPSATILSSAPPSAFGFLKPQPKPILLDGARIGLQKSLALIGGNIGVLGASVVGNFEGSLDLVSVGSAGEVVLDINSPSKPIDVSSFSRLGLVDIGENSQVAAAEGSGLRVRAGDLLVDGPQTILAQANEFVGGSAGIDIVATGDVIVSDGATLRSETFAGENGSDVSIVANRLVVVGNANLVTATGTVDGGATPRDPNRSGNGGNLFVRANAVILDGRNSPLVTGIASEAETNGVGNGGNIDIETKTLQVYGRAGISTNAFSSGSAGNIVVRADAITLDRETSSGFNGIRAQTNATSGGGKGGTINLQEVGQLSLANGAKIDATTLGDGVGGTIVIDADSIVLDSGGVDGTSNEVTSISARSDAQTGGGNAGNIEITAREMRLSDGALVSSSTLGNGDGGSVTIKADTLSLSGTRSTIASNSQDPAGGKSGGVSLKVTDLSVTKGALISAGTRGNQIGGKIEVVADTVVIDGQGAATQTAISSETAGGRGRGGDIEINAREVQILDGGTISTNTFGPGEGGDIQIGKAKAAGNVTLDGRGSRLFTGITAGTSVGSSGAGGGVRMESADVEIRNEALVNASTLGAGKGGNIEIVAGNVSLDTGGIAALARGTGDADSVSIDASGRVVISDASTVNVTSEQSNGGDISITGAEISVVDSEINALAEGISPNGVAAPNRGNGGNVRLNASGQILVQDGVISAQARRDGGNISATADQIVFQRGQILANAILGNGGNISLRSQIYLPSAESIIDASSQFGIDGNVAIESPNTNVGGSLIFLPSNLLDAESFLAARCVVRGTDAASSFTVNPPNGVPTQPGELLPSR